MRARAKAKLVLAVQTAAAAIPLTIIGNQARATINGPYTVDGNTVMLYHLDETAPTSQAINAQTLTNSAYSINMTTRTTSGAATTLVLGQSLSYTGFGNAASFPSGGVMLGYDGNADGGFTSDTTTLVAGPDAISGNFFTGGSGEFTLEALVQTPVLSTWANNTNHEIINLDSNNATANRGFQFRVMKTSAGVYQLNYNNISKGSSNIVLNLPTAGSDAIADSTWYHVAAVYSGGNTAGNVRLYWTKVDPNNTYAHLLGTGLSAGALTAGVNPLVIGNKARWNNETSEAWGGAIDEVRISNSVRSAYQMMFAGFTPDFWQGDSGDWDSAGNWSAGVPNSVTANAFFGSGSPIPPTADSTITLNGTKTLNSMSIDTAPYNFTFTSGVSGALSLSSGATVTAISGNTLMAVPVTIATQADVSVANTAALTLAGNISGSGTLALPGAGPVVISGDLGTGVALNANGSGNVTLSGTVTSTSGLNNSGSGTLAVGSALSGAQSVTSSGSGVVILSNTSNNYTGATTATGGVIRANNGAGLSTSSNLLLNGGVLETGTNFARAAGTGAGAVQITGGTSGFSANGADIQVAYGTIATPTALTWGAATFNPAALVLNSATATNNISFLNAVNLSGKAAAVQVNAQTATMSGVISDSSVGQTGTLTKSGGGTLVLTGVNTYGGTTSVTGGILVAAGSALPGTTNVILNAGLFGSSLTRAVGTGAGQIQLTGGNAGFTAIGADTTVTLTNGGNAIPWGGATFNPTNLILSSLAGTNNVNLVADLDLNGGTRSVQVNSHVATMSGVISDSSIGQTGALSKIGTAVLVLAGTNTYGGTTTVGAGTLQAVDGVGLPATSNLSVNGGFFGSTITRTVGTAAGQIQLPAGTSGFNAIGSDITVTLQNGGNPVQWGSAAFNPATLVLNNTDATNSVTLATDIDTNAAARNIQVNTGLATISGVISGTGSLQVNNTAAPGILVISNSNNTYSGGTILNNSPAIPTRGLGILRAAASNALGTGTIDIGPQGNETQARLELIGGISLPNAVALRGRNNDSDAIRNVGGNNTLSGTVTITVGGTRWWMQSDAGTLKVTGSVTSDATNQRTLTVQGAASGEISGVISNGTATMNVAKAGAGTWILSGANTYTGATSVNAGTLVFGQSARTSSALSVADGSRAAVAPRSSGGKKTLQVGTLNLNTSGTLDLADNDLVVDNGSFTTIKAAVLTGFGTTGPGITSSTSDGSQILALFDNALIGAGDWNGGTIGAAAVVGKYTYFGDVNFDGQVTGDDYTIIDSNLNTTPPVGLEWLSGDANLDGIVTGDDYTTIDSNLGLGTGNPLSSNSLGGGLTPSALGAAAVPEPGGLGIIAGAALMLARRRRRV